MPEQLVGKECVRFQGLRVAYLAVDSDSRMGALEEGLDVTPGRRQGNYLVLNRIASLKEDAGCELSRPAYAIRLTDRSDFSATVRNRIVRFRYRCLCVHNNTALRFQNFNNWRWIADVVHYVATKA
jgi:hypothetical protein